VKVEKPEKFAVEGMGPEYETLCLFGTSCLIDDLPAVVKANDMCNRYGIDTISAGGIVGLLMECCERGWITKEDTDGIEVSWGSSDALLSVIEKIALRSGFGTILAEGVRAAAEWIGNDAGNLAVHVKGLDLPAHDPRAFYSMMINYATGNRGACHLHGSPYFVNYGVFIPEAGVSQLPDPFSTDKKSYIAAKFQDYCEVFDSLVQCKFMAFGLTINDQVNMLSNVTGWKTTAGELLRIGVRIFNLQRFFNASLGIGRKDDALPRRMFKPTDEGPHAGKIVSLDQMIEEYYEIRGWDSNGIPTKNKLKELELTEMLAGTEKTFTHTP